MVEYTYQWQIVHGWCYFPWCFWLQWFCITYTDKLRRQDFPFIWVFLLFIWHFRVLFSPDLSPCKDVPVSLGLLAAATKHCAKILESAFTPVGFCRSNQLGRVKLEVNSPLPKLIPYRLLSKSQSAYLVQWRFTLFVWIWKADVVEGRQSQGSYYKASYRHRFAVFQEWVKAPC